jgi:hypothetical protein
VRVAQESPREDYSFGATVDRRRSRRFPVRLEVLAQWKDEEGNMHDAAGFSQNIGERGVLIASSVPPPQATKVTIEALIPAQREGLQDLRLRSEGLVVRLEENDGAVDYAVHCHFRPLRTGHTVKAQ